MALPPPPPVVADAGTVFGHVAVRVGARSDRLEVVVDGRVRARLRIPPGPRRVSVPVPVGRHEVRVRARGRGGEATSAPVAVWALPRSAARAGRVPGVVDAPLQSEVARLAGALPAVSGVYVQHLVTGCGAAVNAGAPFPAVSTLKAAILVEAVRRAGGRPPPTMGSLLDRMVVDSDDPAANTVLGLLGGPAAVTSTLRAIGLTESLLRRPYLIEDARAASPLTIDATALPALRTNFVATPYELARLMVAVHRAALGTGSLHRIGVSAATARRELLPRLLSVRDGTKIVAGLPPGMPVAHKSGYTTEVKHDAGIVYLPGGPVIVSAMTWSGAGVDDAVGDRFVAAVAGAARHHLGDGGSCRAAVSRR